MDEFVKKAMEAGEVFDKIYVHQLREEAKSTRLDLTRAEVKIESLQKETSKKLTTYEIGNKLAQAGINVSPESVYFEGKTADEAIKIFSEKNPAFFRKEKIMVAGDLEIDAETAGKLNKPWAEVKKDPAARNVISRMYQKFLQTDRDRGHMLSPPSA